MTAIFDSAKKNKDLETVPEEQEHLLAEYTEANKSVIERDVTPTIPSRWRPLQYLAAVFWVYVMVSLEGTLLNWPNRSGKSHGSHAPSAAVIHRPASPPAKEGTPVAFNEWSKGEEKPDFELHSKYVWYSSVSNYTLPLEESHGLFVHAMGSDYSGTIYIIDDDEVSKDRVNIGIEAVYHDEAKRDSLWVGQLDGNRGAGVGIYGHDQDSGHRGKADRWKWDEIRLYVHVRIPVGAKMPPYSIRSSALSLEWLTSPSTRYSTIDADLDSGGITLGDVSAETSVSISTKAGHIHSLSPDSGVVSSPRVAMTSDAGSMRLGQVNASTASVRTQTGSISGHFTVYESLDLFTSSGSIHVDIDLPDKRSSVTIDQSQRQNVDDDDDDDNHTEANLALALAPAPAPIPVSVSAQSHTGSVHVTYTGQSPRVLLHSTLSTSSGSIQLSHAEEFTGDFEYRTNVGSLKIWNDRKRDLVIREDKKVGIGRFIVGEVKPGGGGNGDEGGDADEEKGSSKATAVTGSVQVHF